ncbi:MAG TPA: caspase family protein [Candidatus Obscuribacterales bacterium]
MRVRRRTFLQTSVALTAYGLSQVGMSWMADRYHVALAQPTRRKLALLVGINTYPDRACDSETDCWAGRGSGIPLQGCLTDVELQRELLLHRFGFSDRDIVTLVNDQATREGIETAFLSHLVEQARPGDVVVFHFSGFGSRLQSMGSDRPLRSLVPVDGLLPTPEHPVINDICLDTLGLLLQSLKTDQVVTVLDTSYTTPASILQGTLRVRSRPNAPSGQISEGERALQEQLLSQLKVSREQLAAQVSRLQFPGMVLSAAADQQPAAEGQWNGFSAGLFTYALTQQLWSATPATTLRNSLSRASGTIEQVVGGRQQPMLTGNRSTDQKLLPYYLPSILNQGADGVIQTAGHDGKGIQVLLAGVPAQVLEQYGPDTVLTADAPMNGNPDGGPPSTILLRLRSRDGLRATARLCCNSPASVVLTPGQPVYESIRVIPRQVGLTVAIDPSLERVERVDATSAFSTLASISSVVSGGQPADCLFSKTQPLTQTIAASLPSDRSSTDPDVLTQVDVLPAGPDLLPSKTSYGLFYLGKAAIPNTTAEDDEAVKTAVTRLTPRLRTLLGTKLVRLTESGGSSRLGVRATLELVTPQERIVAQQETGRAPWMPPEGRLAALLASSELPELPMGGRIQYRLYNYSDRPIYFILFGLDSNSNAIALYPADPNASSPGNVVIQPGEILTIPSPSATSEWVVRGAIAPAETHLVFSRSPFSKTTALLNASMPSRNSASRVSVVHNPLEVARAILDDLHHATKAASDRPLEFSPDTYAFNVNDWATFSFMYRITEEPTA